MVDASISFPEQGTVAALRQKIITKIIMILKKL